MALLNKRAILALANGKSHRDIVELIAYLTIFEGFEGMVFDISEASTDFDFLLLLDLPEHLLISVYKHFQPQLGSAFPIISPRGAEQKFIRFQLELFRCVFLLSNKCHSEVSSLNAPRNVPDRETQYIIAYATTQLNHIVEMITSEFSSPWSGNEILGEPESFCVSYDANVVIGKFLKDELNLEAAVQDPKFKLSNGNLPIVLA
jgi:hypothetical protein